MEKTDKSIIVQIINDVLSTDPQVNHMLPLNDEDDSLFDALYDGILLFKLI